MILYIYILNAVFLQGLIIHGLPPIEFGLLISTYRGDFYSIFCNGSCIRCPLEVWIELETQQTFKA